jgi:hypothetical protein
MKPNTAIVKATMSKNVCIKLNEYKLFRIFKSSKMGGGGWS